MITIKDIISLSTNHGLRNALFISDDTSRCAIEVRDGVLYFKQPCVEDILISSLTDKELNEIDEQNNYYTREVLAAERKRSALSPDSTDFDVANTESVNNLLESEHFELTWDLYEKKIAKELPTNRDGEWLLKWDVGSIHLGGFKDKQVEARHRAALFIFLSRKGVEAILAKDLTVCYFMGILPIEG